MKAKTILCFCFFLFISALPASLKAQLQVDRIFTDHMVLQHDKPVMIGGKANPSSTVSVQFKAQKKSTIAARDSSWSVLLDPSPASILPANLSIRSAREKIILKNILVGDIWLCIGQSNMEFPMQQEMHYEQELSCLKGPCLQGSRLLRFFDPIYAGQGIYGKAFTDSVISNLNTRDFYKGRWSACDSSSIMGMSAVGYYFGKAIANETGIPVGLINIAIGGASIETFISREALSENEFFRRKLEGDWLNNSTIPVWVRQRGRENIPVPSKDPSGPDHAFKPGFAFDAGIKPLLNFPIKGIIWYQGESNAQELERVNEYEALQKLMVSDLRKKWKDKDLPFYYVQLSSIDTISYKSQLWPLFRDEQRKVMEKIPNSGMAVTSDHGAKSDVHPRNKKVVGERLSRWALLHDYGKNIEASGPRPSLAVLEDSVIRIYFQHTAKGLAANGRLKGFSLDGIHEIPADIDDSTVIISLPIDRTITPATVYYGWKPYEDGNLLNSEGLPASTFSIPVVAQPSLIPLPKQLTWNMQKFDLDKCRYIRITDSSLAGVAGICKEKMAEKGIDLDIIHAIENGPAIIFSIDKSVRGEEAYRLTVKKESIVISASSDKGSYYGLQTVLQLMSDDLHIWGCEISDWPSFPWRGYMVDVGRNFQSIRLLKQQIDVMSAYKLNVFHFHLTEDIAWRLEIPGFPQLTEAGYMIRNKGSFYTIEEMKDLVNYCRERKITLVPEIDMPGHSGAFRRALGVDMQSPEGKIKMKKILEAICDTYEVEYIHIGGDEVKIRDSTFLPEMIGYLIGKKKKLIGWDPGG